MYINLWLLITVACLLLAAGIEIGEKTERKRIKRIMDYRMAHPENPHCSLTKDLPWDKEPE